jgi:drug/metabolite transporter (DMT)-like permease
MNDGGQVGGNKQGGAAPQHDWLGYVFALGAAAAYGTSGVLIKVGLNAYGSPFTAITIATVTGMLVLFPLALGSWRSQGAGWRPGRRALLFILASGLCAITGFSANTLALSVLPVTVVTPISSTFPLVTVLLVLIFLRRSEIVSWRTLLGAALIVAGVVVVALNRR